MVIVPTAAAAAVITFPLKDPTPKSKERRCTGPVGGEGRRRKEGDGGERGGGLRSELILFHVGNAASPFEVEIVAV